MNILITIAIVIGLLIVIAVLFVINMYNKLVRVKNSADEGFSGIDVQLKRRYDLIPNLVSVARQYGLHEKNVLEEVTQLRTQALNATGLPAKAAAEEQLSQTLKTIFAVAENYPNLKANELFINLQKELSAIEHEVQLSRRYYNGAARNFNIAIAQFPSSLVANIFNFKPLQFFEITDLKQRDVPKTFE
jgi:LemA protein